MQASDLVKMLVTNYNKNHRVYGRCNEIPAFLVEEPPDNRRQCHDDQSEEREDEVANEAKLKEEEHAGLEDEVVEFVYVGKDDSDCLVEGREELSYEDQKGFYGPEDGFEDGSNEFHETSNLICNRNIQRLYYFFIEQNGVFNCCIFYSY